MHLQDVGLAEGGELFQAVNAAAGQRAQRGLRQALRQPGVGGRPGLAHALDHLAQQSQVEGGVIMGIGHALMEDFKVDEGVIKSDRIARYDVPRMQDLPEITSIIVESRTSEGPFGAKGVGELVCVPTPPAITNAIYHAIGLRVDSLPVTKEKVKTWLDSHSE